MEDRNELPSDSRLSRFGCAALLRGQGGVTRSAFAARMGGRAPAVFQVFRPDSAGD